MLGTVSDAYRRGNVGERRPEDFIRSKKRMTRLRRRIRGWTNRNQKPAKNMGSAQVCNNVWSRQVSKESFVETLDGSPNLGRDSGRTSDKEDKVSTEDECKEKEKCN